MPWRARCETMISYCLIGRILLESSTWYPGRVLWHLIYKRNLDDISPWAQLRNPNILKPHCIPSPVSVSGVTLGSVGIKIRVVKLIILFVKPARFTYIPVDLNKFYIYNNIVLFYLRMIVGDSLVHPASFIRRNVLYTFYNLQFYYNS